MPKGHPISVPDVPWRRTTFTVCYQGKECWLQRASRPGYYNVWPVDGGSALAVNMSAGDAIYNFPNATAWVKGQPDTSD